MRVPNGRKMEPAVPALDHSAVLRHMDSLGRRARRRFALRVLGDKKFRPESREEQFLLLRAIAVHNEFSQGVRSTANIAAAHKAMESLSEARSREMASLVAADLDRLDALGHSYDIRKDRVHLTFSALAVLFHLYLYLDERKRFVEVGERARSTVSRLNRQTLRRGFLVSSTNTVRCLAVSALADFRARDSRRLLETRTLIEKVAFVGYAKGSLRQFLKHEFWPTLRIQLHAWAHGRWVGYQPLSAEVPSVAFRESVGNMRVLYLVDEAGKLLGDQRIDGQTVAPSPNDGLSESSTEQQWLDARTLEHALLRAAVRPRNPETFAHMMRVYDTWADMGET